MSDDFGPSAAWPALELRARLLADVRAFFAARRFLEVETPLLSADVVVDRHLEPLETRLQGERGSQGRRLFLQTSPEFAMKRLLAAGGEAIYQITRAFRQGEIGRLHNPEFTIVEWYRRGDGLDAGMALLSELCAALLARGPAERLTYRAAFQRFAGFDPLADDLEQLRRCLHERRIVPPASLEPGDRDGWLDVILVELVEPNLGRGRPTILHDYPPSQAALAQVRAEQPPLAERFELYVDGIELANGYHELLDPQVLRSRNRENNVLRQRDGRERLPEESRLLAAMDHGLPPCAGVALGFDRVVMLAAGAASLAEVLAFPIDRA
ncbi:MAG TPA: EF-P lysine aminoacylase EpmA [Pirellulales bacterium]|jgi:lysyl-tRNA synthetase class 2|nr:EF-P lysine aminoacylase EpmA [Pirellulales bacterium]